MLIRKEIHILVRLRACLGKYVVKLIESYDDISIHFVKNNQNNIFYKP